MIHPTAVIGAPPGMFMRTPDGRRVELTARSDPPTEIADDVSIGALAMVVAGTGHPTRIGAGSVLLNRAHVGHDCQIGEHTVIGGAAVVCGFVTIGDRCTISANATITPLVTIGDDCFVGAGVVVHEDMPSNTKVTVNGRRRNWDALPWSG